MAQKYLPLWREPDFFCAPDKERLIQLLLKRLDGLAHRGLGDKELFGSFGEAQSRCYIIKYFVKFIIDIHYKSSL